MAVRLITEVLRYLGRNDEVTTTERLVLVLIAERANEQTREAWPGGTEAWDLGRLAGLTPTGLRGALQRLAQRGLEVRVAHGKDTQGRPVYAGWNRQTTYRLPILLGDVQASPSDGGTGDEIRPRRRRGSRVQETTTASVGDVQASPSDSGVGDVQASVGDAYASVGDVPRALGDVQASPFSSSPSGPSRSVTGDGDSPRPATPRVDPAEENPYPPMSREEALAHARAVLPTGRRDTLSRFYRPRAEAEPNPHFTGIPIPPPDAPVWTPEPTDQTPAEALEAPNA